MRSILGVILCFGILSSAPAWAIVVTISTIIEGGDRPIVVGTTNLPEGTVVMVMLSRIADGYSKQITTTVHNGGFRAGPFEENRGWLGQGRYDVAITVPTASGQTQSVLDQIGKNGSKLEGPLVEEAGVPRTKIIEYHRKLTIGDPFAVDKHRAVPETEEKRRYDWIGDWDGFCRSLCDLDQKRANEIYKWFDWESCHQACMDREP